MLDILSFMAAPFAACLVLIGIHGYFGLHVLAREVIFIDIALAQIAALGTTVAFLLHINPESTLAYFFSLGFTLIAAAVYSFTRFKKQVIPQEAIIGISYAVAAAAALILTDKAAGGAEHVKEMLTGSILWVKWSELLPCALVYFTVGLVHIIFREKFILISQDYSEAVEKKIHIRLWDFLFYASFGLVITHSVRMSGVLVVFAILVVPSTLSALFANSWGVRVTIAWVVGTIASMIGLYCSYVFDFSSGPAVVCFLGLFLVLAALFKLAVRSS